MDERTNEHGMTALVLVLVERHFEYSSVATDQGWI